MMAVTQLAMVRVHQSMPAVGRAWFSGNPPEFGGLDDPEVLEISEEVSWPLVGEHPHAKCASSQGLDGDPPESSF
jgi:hypothetical protein